MSRELPQIIFNHLKKVQWRREKLEDFKELLDIVDKYTEDIEKYMEWYENARNSKMYIEEKYRSIPDTEMPIEDVMKFLSYIDTNSPSDLSLYGLIITKKINETDKPFIKIKIDKPYNSLGYGLNKKVLVIDSDKKFQIEHLGYGIRDGVVISKLPVKSVYDNEPHKKTRKLISAKKIDYFFSKDGKTYRNVTKMFFGDREYKTTVVSLNNLKDVINLSCRGCGAVIYPIDLILENSNKPLEFLEEKCPRCKEKFGYNYDRQIYYDILLKEIEKEDVVENLFKHIDDLWFEENMDNHETVKDVLELYRNKGTTKYKRIKEVVLDSSDLDVLDNFELENNISNTLLTYESMLKIYGTEYEIKDEIKPLSRKKLTLKLGETESDRIKKELNPKLKNAGNDKEKLEIIFENIGRKYKKLKNLQTIEVKEIISYYKNELESNEYFSNEFPYTKKLFENIFTEIKFANEKINERYMDCLGLVAKSKDKTENILRIYDGILKKHPEFKETKTLAKLVYQNQQTPVKKPDNTKKSEDSVLNEIYKYATEPGKKDPGMWKKFLNMLSDENE